MKKKPALEFSENSYSWIPAFKILSLEWDLGIDFKISFEVSIA